MMNEMVQFLALTEAQRTELVERVKRLMGNPNSSEEE